MSQYNKTIRFKDIPLDSTFTPIKMAPFFKKDPGNGQTYVKKANGVCPQVGVSKILEDGTVTNGGVFYPDDIVHPVKVPFGFIKEYVRG